LSTTPIDGYLGRVGKALSLGNATEHTHRGTLQNLLEQLHNKITVTNEPKRIKCGAPDFIISRGHTPLGYIEAKDIGTDLDRIADDEQLTRYRHALSNLILTDYISFAWFVNGEQRESVRIASVDARGKLSPLPKNYAGFEALFDHFVKSKVPVITTSRDLALRMAGSARLIRDVLRRAFASETSKGELHEQFKSFKQVLLHELNEEQFADMYAQTICYGLFSARCNAPDVKPFTRKDAAYELPKTNPFLRKLFGHIAGPDLDDRVAWAVDDLAELLERADIKQIVLDFNKRRQRENPVIHFYETFLSEYNPEMRELRGVFFTPESVVSYIVESTDVILRKQFGLSKGLADSSKIKRGSAKSETHKLQILDPAAGTGTFLHAVIDKILAAFRSNRGMWSDYVHTHLLPRLYGFELLMAPYAVAHMVLGMKLRESGYNFLSDERLRLYLTNSLEEAHDISGLSLFANWLAEEANNANDIKEQMPVMVVLGNPPYSKLSANNGEWVNGLLRGKDIKQKTASRPYAATSSYFEVDGKPLGERNPKWLNDDYVKFVRFAQWRIEKTGYGILAFITNHGYLDNPTFRGMRRTLMQTFDDIYILDLHGNSLKTEAAPTGVTDKNVFDIRPGVAIGIFVKRNRDSEATKIHHAELWGSREDKYDYLYANNVATTSWKEVAPQSPAYLFVPQDGSQQVEYATFMSIKDAFGLFNSTVTTARNDFAMAFDEKTLIRRVDDLLDRNLSDDEIRLRYPSLRDVSYWNLATARSELANIGKPKSYIRTYCYRPFDFRYVFYHKALVERMRLDVMGHMLDGNVAFLTHRPQSPQEFTFSYCTEMIGDQCVVANKSAGGGNSFQFPLYQFSEARHLSMFDEKLEGKESNLSAACVEAFSKNLGLKFVNDGYGDFSTSFGPEDVFNYIYAITYSPGYRERYSAELRRDFLRFPITSDKSLFKVLASKGADLRALHLMRSNVSYVTNFPVAGTNQIDVVKFECDPNGVGRVHINKSQYFGNMPREVWEFEIGAYRMCEKWLKDRKGLNLTFDDLDHYQKMAASITQTIQVMADIETAIRQCGGWPIK
jgi:predicted helicase